jgi:uncharacterized protein (DUF1778 family)
MARYEKTYAGERRTAFVGLHLTPSERAELDSAAALQGANVSDYSRELLFRRSAAVVAGTRRNPEAASLIRALDSAAYQNNAVGNLLNQLSRIGHTTGELGTRRLLELDDAIDRFNEIVELYKAALSRVIAL